MYIAPSFLLYYIFLLSSKILYKCCSAKSLAGFRNTNSQISASLTSNGKYVVSASEDSHVYVWRNENESRPNRTKGVTLTRSYESFHCQDVSVAIPWPGLPDAWGLQSAGWQNGNFDSFEDLSMANHPTTPVEETSSSSENSSLPSGCRNSPLNGTVPSNGTNSCLFEKISVTWPEEKLVPATSGRNRSSPRVSVDFSNGFYQNRTAWGMVIVTAGLRGEIRTFQNFGLPVRI